ncbi:phosphotransferase [Desulfobulbus sp.]|uniref:aminoglycoside phosphotransferase family protein n=1 Tax=Desulfobulbus sp. TaxID=895 RepID=UPI00286EB6EE|nr:phosphotransferase [Desulfobulbus sp.]
MNIGELVDLAGRLLGASPRAWNRANVAVHELVPDGSSRRFYRLRGPDRSGVVAVLPPPHEPRGLAEAIAFAEIGRHLGRTGAPVPAIHGFDSATGLALCEDLGERRLFEQVAEQGVEDSIPAYESAVRQLARMQVRGADGFDPVWCWDTPRYDRQLMIERESNYFLRACCTDLLGLDFDRRAVEADCARLADQAARAPAHFFLHRDFQCRNLMLTEGAVRIVDFQGGRLGPLAYDLASLLLDPYAALPEAIQDRLVAVYLEALGEELAYDPDQFRREYLLLGLQRNLQILGAFAFLSQVRGKPFFARYLEPALASLDRLLAKPGAGGYAALHTLTGQCRQELCQRS